MTPMADAVARRGPWRRAAVAAAAVLAAVALAGCTGGLDDVDDVGDLGDIAALAGDEDRPTNRLESARVTGIGVVSGNRSVAAEIELEPALFCPDTDRVRFTVRSAFVGQDAVLGWSSNVTTVPADGNASVRVQVPPFVDLRDVRLIRVQAFQNGSRATPTCQEIADPGDEPTTATRFVANVTARGVGDVSTADPPDLSVQS